MNLLPRQILTIASPWIKMLRLLTALFLFSPQAEAVFLCKIQFETGDLFFSQAAFGEERTDKLPFPLLPGMRVFRLGAGYAGGIVYRILQPQEKSRIIKEYYYKDQGAVDIGRLETLSKAFEKYPAKNGDQFKIVETQLINREMIYVEDHFGVPLSLFLDGVIRHPGVTPELQEHFQKKYDRLLAHAFAALQMVVPNLVNLGEGRFFPKEPDLSVHKKFILKPDNILVTPDGNLIIIDPY